MPEVFLGERRAMVQAFGLHDDKTILEGESIARNEVVADAEEYDELFM